MPRSCPQSPLRKQTTPRSASKPNPILSISLIRRDKALSRKLPENAPGARCNVARHSNELDYPHRPQGEHPRRSARRPHASYPLIHRPRAQLQGRPRPAARRLPCLAICEPAASSCARMGGHADASQFRGSCEQRTTSAPSPLLTPRSSTSKTKSSLCGVLTHP